MAKTITLNVWDVEEIPEELYDLLLEQFLAKAEKLGLDPNEILIDDWTIQAQVSEEAAMSTMGG